MSHPVFLGSGMRRPRVKEEPVSWKERLEALRYVPALFRLIWHTHRGYTTAMIVLRVARAASLIESLLGDLFSNAMSVQLMEHAAKLDLAQFEDPEFYDHLERARE